MPKKLTQEQFIDKANNIHDFKYDYSKVEYRNNYTEVIIICPAHGEYLQKPVNHLRSECKQCASKTRNKKLTKSKELFIEEAKEKHQNKYDYSKTKYNGTRNNIIIICPEHGEFSQIAYNHLRGYGCPSCSSSKAESRIKKWLSNNNIKFEEQKRFENCKNSKPLPFDFWLSEKNILIEYDGVGHYKPTTFGGTSKEQAIENLKNQKTRDLIKTQYAKENKIKLIRISYLQEKNIEKLLDKLLL